MIQERDVIPLFLDACPSFKPIWEQHRAYWGDEDAGGYVDMSEVARHLVELIREKHTECFSSVFAIICIGQGHVAQVPDESYADHPTAPDADATISQCIDA